MALRWRNMQQCDTGYELCFIGEYVVSGIDWYRDFEYRLKCFIFLQYIRFFQKIIYIFHKNIFHNKMQYTWIYKNTQSTNAVKFNTLIYNWIDWNIFQLCN